MRAARAGWLAAMAALSASAAAPGVAAPFADPLDVPSLPSALAANRPLAAVVRSGERLVAAGARGHVLLSDDGGGSWTQAAVPVSTDLTALAFPSPRRGWAVGHDGVVLATADGGRTWTRQLDGRGLAALLARAPAPGRRAAARDVLRSRGVGQSFLDVWFDDERTGFAVGAFGLLLATRDGGERWEAWVDRAENPRALHLYAVRRAAGALWIAGERGLLLRLDPAARRFRAVRVGYGGTLFGVTGDDRTVLVHGLQGTALRSADGGASWRPVHTGTASGLTGSALLPDGRLVVVSLAGELLVSADALAPFGPPLARALPASAVAPSGGDDAVVVVGPGGARRERLP